MAGWCVEVAWGVSFEQRQSRGKVGASSATWETERPLGVPMTVTVIASWSTLLVTYVTRQASFWALCHTPVTFRSTPFQCAPGVTGKRMTRRSCDCI